jgi:hypothetical protein
VTSGWTEVILPATTIGTASITPRLRSLGLRTYHHRSIPSYRSHETDLHQLSTALTLTTNRISELLSISAS